MTGVISCPLCRGLVANDLSLAGQAVQCPHCQQKFTLPPLAIVRAVTPPVVAGPSNPINAAGRRYRKRKQDVPIWAWIVGGFGVLILSCCGGLLMMLPNGEQMKQAREHAHERQIQKMREATQRIEAKADRFDKEWEAGRDEREARAKAFAQIAAKERLAEVERSITMAEYERIGFSDTPESVAIWLGVEGVETGSSGPIKMMKYRGSNGVTVMVTFHRRNSEWAYSSKSQFGL